MSFLFGNTTQHHGKLNVFQRAENGNQIESLEHKPDFLKAHLGKLFFGLPADIIFFQ